MFRSMYYSLAERVGFEPTVPLGITGFQWKKKKIREKVDACVEKAKENQRL